VVAVNPRIACLSIDMEPDLRDPSRRIRLLEDDARMQALTDLLRRERVPLTVFAVMSEARRYADRLNALAAEATVEFGVHSFSHDVANPASDYEVRRAIETFGEVWNDRPAGYRSPNCLIDEKGIDSLMRGGFVYDSSIVPSLRIDGYGYNNLRFGRDPFRFEGPSGAILELPIACLGGIRLPLIFSYVKLFVLSSYRAALRLFPLPDVVVTYFHPYDLYIEDVAPNIPGWKRVAHRRNGRQALRLLERLIVELKARGYTFALMKDVARDLLDSELQRRRLRLVA
jgi:peptidoglycan/xylan/chitin deacetylase (PgdA/CDA1 family)